MKIKEFLGREIKIKFKYFISIISIILIVNILSINVYADEKKSEDIVKVGVYEYGPYVFEDSNGNIRGYYHDLLNLIRTKYDFEYEYVVCNISDGLKQLNNDEIDIMFGLPVTIENYENIIFNQYNIDEEKFGIFTKKNIALGDLKQYPVVKLGLVEDDYNAEWVLKFFESNNINLEVVYDKNYENLEQLMEEGKIDLMVDSAYKKTKYILIYEFAGSQIYIGANKNNKYILDNIDNAIKYLGPKDKNPITKLHNKYFNEEYKNMLFKEMVLIVILAILSLLVLIIIIIPRIKKRIIKNKIRLRMDEDKYLLQYQPIYNPRNEDIIGFEGLLRLLDDDNNLIPPYKFIPEIEDNDMLFEISLWILKKAISDYSEIKSYENMNGKDFYISINLSLNEIENDDFVKKAIKILSKSNLGPNKICLEIIERVKMNDIHKINENINHLKEAGFKIAIDDFGVEYSNLDVLQKLDIDTIKIDKNFVDGIGKDIIRNEIVMFISKIASTEKKSVVLEGVEEEEQDTEIKKIPNKLLYVQGYYYNKPMYIQDIGKI